MPHSNSTTTKQYFSVHATMQRCSNLADKVLWDGEGAISTRQMPPQEAKSTTGTSSVDGEDDEWDVTYIRKESFQKMFPNGQLSQPIGWMQRFRPRRLCLEPSRQGMTPSQRCSSLATATTGTNEDVRQRHEGTSVITSYDFPAEEIGHRSMESPPYLNVHDSVRTTRDEVDGTTLLKRQNAKVFNRPSLAKDWLFIPESSDESASDDIHDALDKVTLLRHLSSITTFEHGSLRHVSRADWGDPFLKPDSRLRWAHDGDREDPDVNLWMAHDAQQQGSVSYGTESAGCYYRMAEPTGEKSIEDKPYLPAHHSVRSTRDDIDETKTIVKQNGGICIRALLARGSSSDTGSTEDTSNTNSESESLRCTRIDSGDHLTMLHSTPQWSHDDDCNDVASGFCVDHASHQSHSERSPTSVERFRDCRDRMAPCVEVMESPSGESANEEVTCPNLKGAATLSNQNMYQLSMTVDSGSSCLRRGLFAGSKHAEFYIPKARMVDSSSFQCDIAYNPVRRIEPQSSYLPATNVVADACTTNNTNVDSEL